MLGLPLGNGVPHARRILALGAHADDIEIGCGGTILELGERYPELEVCWVVVSAPGARAEEARRSAESFLSSVRSQRVIIGDFRDGFFPYEGGRVKEFFEEVARSCSPDLIFTHQLADRHQDHRLVAELTWNTFRDHAILEYEIPKYDGDLGQPNVFVPLSEGAAKRKIEGLLAHFPSQAGKHWFDEETFRATLRLRGLEVNSPSRQAEAFYSRKLLLHP